MIIVGADLSPTSSGFVKFILDEKLEILDIKKLGFCGYIPPKKKTFEVPKYKDIISYNKDEYDFYNRTLMMQPYIFEFLEGCDYLCIEDYAFAGNGDITQLAEFCSQVKFFVLKHGGKVRLISPLQNKQFLADDSRAEKPDMYDAFIKLEFQKPDISDLPEIPVHVRGKFVGCRDKDGVSPMSDIIDSYSLVYLLLRELQIKKGIKTLSEFIPQESHVLSHKTPKNKIPLYQREFISRK